MANTKKESKYKLLLSELTYIQGYLTMSNAKNNGRAGGSKFDDETKPPDNPRKNLSLQKEFFIELDAIKLRKDIIAWSRADDDTIFESAETLVLETTLGIMLNSDVWQYVPVGALFELCSSAGLRFENYIVYNSDWSK